MMMMTWLKRTGMLLPWVEAYWQYYKRMFFFLHFLIFRIVCEGVQCYSLCFCPQGLCFLHCGFAKFAPNPAYKILCTSPLRFIHNRCYWLYQSVIFLKTRLQETSYCISCLSQSWLLLCVFCHLLRVKVTEKSWWLKQSWLAVFLGHDPVKRCKPLATRSVNTLNSSLNRGCAVVSTHIGETVGFGDGDGSSLLHFFCALMLKLHKYLTSNSHILCSYSYTTRSYRGKKTYPFVLSSWNS